MSRPKGSKNKKTIEKEGGGEREESTSVGVVEEEEVQTEEKDFTVSEEKISPATENKNNWDNFEFENDVPPIGSKMRSKSSEKQPSVCKRCGRELITAPCRVDTNMIAGRVSTHREHPRFVTICMGCATELSELVDKWLGKYPTKWEDHSDGY